MIICQGFLNGNGFFLFDDTTIDKTVTKTNEIEKSIPHPTKGKFLDRMV